jgi:hypothetical protein
MCHNWHKEARDTNRISLGKIIEVLNTQPSFRLKRMITNWESRTDGTQRSETEKRVTSKNETKTRARREERTETKTE